MKLKIGEEHVIARGCRPEEIPWGARQFPQTGLYSPYYSAELFRSDDNAHSFKQVSHMEYEADGHEYPYQSGGFSDSDFEFMDDGSIIWGLRSAWAMYTGREWDPMYISRSEDMGKHGQSR